MLYSFEKFQKTLNTLNIKPISDCPSCPRKLDHFCLANQTDCDLGNNNKCEQIYKFILNGAFYYITVRFYGEDKKGFIKTDESNIRNLAIKEKTSFAELLNK